MIRTGVLALSCQTPFLVRTLLQFLHVLVKRARAEWISISVPGASRGGLGPSGLARLRPGCCATIPRPAQSHAQRARQGRRQHGQPPGPREPWALLSIPPPGRSVRPLVTATSHPAQHTGWSGSAMVDLSAEACLPLLFLHRPYMGPVPSRVLLPPCRLSCRGSAVPRELDTRGGAGASASSPSLGQSPGGPAPSPCMCSEQQARLDTRCVLGRVSSCATLGKLPEPQFLHLEDGNDSGKLRR